MYWDTHMHCRFSGDSTADPKAMIESSIEKKLEGICFTDHIDWDYPGPTPFHFDPEEYMQTLQPLAEQYSSQIRVHIGVELGLQPHLKERYHAFVEAADFDQVIVSSHVWNTLRLSSKISPSLMILTYTGISTMWYAMDRIRTAAIPTGNFRT